MAAHHVAVADHILEHLGRGGVRLRDRDRVRVRVRVGVGDRVRVRVRDGVRDRVTVRARSEHPRTEIGGPYEGLFAGYPPRRPRRTWLGLGLGLGFAKP